MKHLFLIGRIQCGKSTLIQAIMHQGAGKLITAGGFLTYFSNRDGKLPRPRTLHLGDAGVYAQLFSQNQQMFLPVSPERLDQALTHGGNPSAIAATFTGEGGPQIHLDTFDRYGKTCIEKGLENAARLSKNPNIRPVLVLDECGYLESDASVFQQSVHQALEQPYTVLGVVRQQDKPSWLDSIRNHPNVQIVTVTEQNRDRLVTELTKELLLG